MAKRGFGVTVQLCFTLKEQIDSHSDKGVFSDPFTFAGSRPVKGASDTAQAVELVGPQTGFFALKLAIGHPLPRQRFAILTRHADV
ncbi:MULTISPECIES: hypothetical protein [Mycobacterium]|uniref:Uncharacterized protein n=1 Tax=Mycobacterium gordonae TaxID=1778 RepID=A0A1A6BIB9_MYCGO|nr:MULTISPECIES: hypothetical protein [Mycobacterium]OBS02078.1 hypothetical protein A9W98_16750 [Mycobacterium gordonae]